MPVKLGLHPGGGVTTANAEAAEAITAGEAVFVKGDGKIIGATATADAEGEKVAEQPARSDYSGYPFFNTRIFINLAAGRGLWIGTEKKTHESGDQLKAKELEVNTTTGDITAGGYNGQPDSAHYDGGFGGGGYLMDVVWSATQKSWILVARGNYDPGAGRAAYDLCFERIRFATDNQRTHTAVYHAVATIASAGAEYQAAVTGAGYGAGGLVLDSRNDKIYFYSVGSSNTYGKNCVQMHWIDWSADADITTSDMKNRVTAGYTHGSYTTSCRGCFDSLRNQVVIATTPDSGYIDLVAFDVTEAGGITYSHSSTNAHHMTATSTTGYYVRDIEMDAAGNYCVMGGDHNVYVGKNTGSAFTPSSAAVIRPPGAIGIAVAMKYFPVYDQWTGIWCKNDTEASNKEDPTYLKQWQVTDGVAGSKTVERENKNCWQTHTSGVYVGPEELSATSNYATGRGGLAGALTSNGVFYSAGGKGPQSYVWNSFQEATWIFRNDIRLSAAGMGNYLGVASADIADGATGEILVEGGEKDGYSNLIPGESYHALDSDGTITQTSSLTAEQKLSAHYVGTATSTTKLLIGQDIRSSTSSGRGTFIDKAVASGLSRSDVSRDNVHPELATSGSGGWYDTTYGSGQHVGTESVYATPGKYILDIQGAGVITLLAYSSTRNGGEVYSITEIIVDGVVIQQISNVRSSLQYPVKVLGTLAPRHNVAGAGFVVPDPVGISFNESFQVLNKELITTGISTTYTDNWKLQYMVTSYDN